jgi:acid stress-induced BolA-like protein IbaG/YrbA
MTESEIKDILMQALALHEVHVSGDGSHFQVIAIDDRFAQMNRVKKQQTVFTPLSDCIADNRIHALTVKTFTPEEWKRHRLLNGI